MGLLGVLKAVGDMAVLSVLGDFGAFGSSAAFTRSTIFNVMDMLRQFGGHERLQQLARIRPC